MLNCHENKVFMYFAVKTISLWDSPNDHYKKQGWHWPQGTSYHTQFYMAFIRKHFLWQCWREQWMWISRSEDNRCCTMHIKWKTTSRGPKLFMHAVSSLVTIMNYSTLSRKRERYISFPVLFLLLTDAPSFLPCRNWYSVHTSVPLG